MSKLADFGENAGFIQEMYDLYRQDPTLVGQDWSNFFAALALKTDGLAQSNGNGNGTHGSQARQSNGSNYHSVRSSESQEFSIDQSDNASLLLKAERLISNYRTYGHLMARVNPLERVKRFSVDTSFLNPEFTTSELDRPFTSPTLHRFQNKTARELIRTLNNIYSGSIGYEYTHLVSQEEVEWLRERIERPEQRQYSKEEKRGF